jgi:hypothetical protein
MTTCDGAGSNTYPAINVGAKIGNRLSPRVQLLLSPQGDIAMTDDQEVGTSNAWVWPSRQASASAYSPACRSAP